MCLCSRGYLEWALRGVKQEAVGYHGTSADKAQRIQSDGFLTARGEDIGNWGRGPFGGNPSNPDLVYVALDQSVARQYARDVGGGSGVVLRVEFDWSSAVLDEDFVFDTMMAGGPTAKIFWSIFAKQQETTEEEAREIIDYMSDSDLAFSMQGVAAEASRQINLQGLVGQMTTVGVRGPVRVVGVE